MSKKVDRERRDGGRNKLVQDKKMHAVSVCVFVCVCVRLHNMKRNLSHVTIY